MSDKLYLGSNDPENIRMGNRMVEKICLGNERIWGYLPDNPVLQITARGLTTAGIAQTNGVTDLSGNNNHGTAYGGVEVVNDSEMGECFSFDGRANQYILANNNDLINRINGLSELTIIVFGKRMGNRNYLGGISNSNGYSLGTIEIGNNNTSKAIFYDRIKFVHAQIKNIQVDVSNLSNWHLYCFTADYTTGTAVTFIDGEEKYKDTTWFKGTKADVDNFVMGNSYYDLSINTFIGRIGDFYIYPYALTANQVKRLYYFMMYPKNPILDISAKGLTTEGIKQENGVIDLSGNGNHGTAYGNISVVTDDELGECFYFYGGYIDIDINYEKTFSVSFFFKEEKYNNYGSQGYSPFFISNKAEYAYLNIGHSGSGEFKVNLHPQGSSVISINPTIYRTKADIGKGWFVTVVIDFENGKLYYYKNGIIDTISTINKSYTYISSLTSIRMGALHSSYSIRAKMSAVKLYPRALTAHEVKKLYLASRK